MSAIVDSVSVRADPYEDPTTIESRFRARRFTIITSMIEEALAEKDRIEILDLGGREYYWDLAADFMNRHKGRIHVHIVNPELHDLKDKKNFTNHFGDACAPDLFEGRLFDIVHSNSVIEHVGDEAKMQAFADNTRRLGERYFMQTPNYWFPMEPHFRAVGFQWLPQRLRVKLVRLRNMGFYPQTENKTEAREIVESIRLLKRDEVAAYFPDAEIIAEKAFGMTKSWMAVKR